MEMKQSFSTSEVATYCHVTADTIRKWAEAGRIRVFKTPGGHRRIRREDLIQFLRENNIPIHGDLKDSGVKILVVDDEKTVTAAIQRFLERSQMPFLVEYAEDGFEAGHQMAVFQPDVVFLDLTLPGLNGAEMCKRIKDKLEYAGTQIIAMVPADTAEASNQALSNGAAVILRKPFTPDDLRRTLAQVGIEIG